jgi:hypothetical protein
MKKPCANWNTVELRIQIERLCTLDYNKRLCILFFSKITFNLPTTPQNATPLRPLTGVALIQMILKLKSKQSIT